MKKSIFLVSILFLTNLQADLKEVLNQGAKVATQNSTSDYKSLLDSALSKAVNELTQNGFLSTDAAKIPLPTSLQAAANLAKNIGGEKWVNELSASINQAATKAVGGAAVVFSNTIKNMSENDIKNLFNGGNNSLTKFLQQKSSLELSKIFKPIIENMMSQNSFATAYNGLNSLISNSNVAKQAKDLAGNFGIDLGAADEDLNSYITRKTLDGLFNVMSQKEQLLRDGNIDKNLELLKGVLK